MDPESPLHGLLRLLLHRADPGLVAGRGRSRRIQAPLQPAAQAMAPDPLQRSSHPPGGEGPWGPDKNAGLFLEWFLKCCTPQVIPPEPMARPLVAAPGLAVGA